MRERFIWRNGWVPKRHFVPRTAGGPMVITDTCEPFKSMADGRVYDSKAAYRTDLKARCMVETAGCNLPEQPLAGPDVSAPDIAEAWDQFDAGHGARPADRPPEHWQGEIE